MKVAKRLNGIGEYYFSQKLREIESLNRQGKSIINLGIGSPDQPPHPEVIKVLQEEAAKPHTHAYQSYKGAPALREAFSEWYNRWYGIKPDPATEVLPLIGSKEGILHICMTYLNPGDEVLVPDPGYPTYQSAVKLAGGQPLFYTLKEKNNYLPDLAKLEKRGLKKVKLMFVNYPHMPTGQLPLPGLFSSLVRFAERHKILLVHDNPYSFILNNKPESLLAVPGAREHVLELNSLSKSHNMAGWRIGVLCGSARRIEEVLRFKSNMDSGMFLPVQLAAAKALTLGNDWQEELNNMYRGRKEKAKALLQLLGCRFSNDQAGLFLWAGIPDGYPDGYALSDDILYTAGVFITPGGIFGKAGKKYVRISLCAPGEKIDEAISRIRKAFKKR